MRLLAFPCGWLTASLGSLLEGEEGTLRVPVPVFLIEHPRGRIHYENGEDGASRLRTLGLEPELWRTLPQAPRELT